MEYFGNEVDGKDIGIIISTLDGCLPCMALLGCDCQKSAAQMLDDQLAGDDGGDPNLRTVANVVGQAGTAIFGAYQAGEVAKKTVQETAAKSEALGKMALTGLGIAVAGILGYAFIRSRYR